jgi:hypothetical protein
VLKNRVLTANHASFLRAPLWARTGIESAEVDQKISQLNKVIQIHVHWLRVVGQQFMRELIYGSESVNSAQGNSNLLSIKHFLTFNNF